MKITEYSQERKVSNMDLEKAKIYDELCTILTMYENDEATDKDLYIMLIKIQDCWEDIITREA